MISAYLVPYNSIRSCKQQLSLWSRTWRQHPNLNHFKRISGVEQLNPAELQGGLFWTGSNSRALRCNQGWSGIEGWSPCLLFLAPAAHCDLCTNTHTLIHIQQPAGKREAVSWNFSDAHQTRKLSIFICVVFVISIQYFYLLWLTDFQPQSDYYL